MSKKELIKMLMERMQNFGYFPSFTNVKIFIQEYEKLAKPEPQAGHADETPLYLRNVIARLRELPLHDREVWLKTIMDEFEEDFCHSIWREGYEQGKFEGAWVGEQLKDADRIRRELNKPVVPQFVADWIEKCKSEKKRLHEALIYTPFGVNSWVSKPKNQNIFARAWLDGYRIEEEKRYLVKMKGLCIDNTYLKQQLMDHSWYFGCLSNSDNFSTYHTRKELEDAGFGEVFNSPLFEVEEVE
jgi:hypothetical protein